MKNRGARGDLLDTGQALERSEHQSIGDDRRRDEVATPQIRLCRVARAGQQLLEGKKDDTSRRRVLEANERRIHEAIDGGIRVTKKIQHQLLSAIHPVGTSACDLAGRYRASARATTGARILPTAAWP